MLAPGRFRNFGKTLKAPDISASCHVMFVYLIKSAISNVALYGDRRNEADFAQVSQ